MNFEKLKEKAGREWAAFCKLDRPRILIGAVTCGRAAGAFSVLAAFEKELSARSLKADVQDVGCLGMCYAEPLVEIGLPDGRRVLYRNVTEEMVPKLIDDFIVKGNPRPDLALATFGDVAIDGIPDFYKLPMMTGQVRFVLRNAGIIDPTNVYHYIAHGGYSGLVRAIGMAPEGVIDEVKESGLRGRGGAGFPTGMKWEFARRSKSDTKYVICNADEGDPGAFMDRAVLESDPHAVLEGLAIAAYAIGANIGYIYARAEYPLAIERLKNAIKQMEELGFAGSGIMGTDFNFTVKIKEGAGAFVCGEETALMASIEGRRGMPRSRPPFPANSGLHGKPTNINNVESLANISEILNSGAKRFAQYGTEKSRGTKTFALAGKINRTGLIEIPMGTRLRDIIYNIGGGIPDGKHYKSVQTGGPSGGCIPEELIDMPVDYEKLAEAGTIMGSGGMVVMDEETCMVDIARYFVEFSLSESCGKCVPCRMGTQQLLNILTRITEGHGKIEDLEKMEKIGATMKQGALCGLGQTVPNPVLTTMRYFRDEYEAHINGYCPSLNCKRIAPAPCQRTCPIGMDVPSYIALIGWERFEDSLDVIYKDNPFPSVCGRICPRPCESNCTRGETDKPLSIRALKRFASDQAMNGARPKKKKLKPTRREKIAVVGAGPCGLTAAHDLANLGYKVTVFEGRKKPGGMLRHAVPEFRISSRIVDSEAERIASMVKMAYGKTLGKNISIKKLSKRFDSVLIATGASKGIPLSLQTRPKVKEYMDAVKFLTAAKSNRASLPGKNVVVIGSGHLAFDSARTAVRLGATKVTMLYPRGKKDLPVSPEGLRIASGEGVNIEYNCLPVEILSKGGKTTGVRCVKTGGGSADDTGRNRSPAIEGAAVTIRCNAVISAIGHKPDVKYLNKEKGIQTGALDNIVVDPVTLETGLTGVFAAGDAVTGGATVIEAIAAGQKAAAAIHRRLSHQLDDKRFKLPRPHLNVEFYEVEEALEGYKRPPEPLLKVKKRIKCFDEAVGSLSEGTAVKEAKRCLRCDLD